MIKFFFFKKTSDLFELDYIFCAKLKTSFDKMRIRRTQERHQRPKTVHMNKITQKIINHNQA